MTFPFSALIFDLDGTLVDSIPAVDRAWRAFSARHNLDASYVVTQIHGRRSIDSVRALLPHVDAEAEDAWIRNQEATDTEGVTAIPGALEFLKSLPCPWAIATSGTTEVATSRMRAVGLPTPQVAVFGEEVANGKPAPDPFLLAAQRLGVDPTKCVVFEDTLAGVRAGHAANMKVVALATTLRPDQLSEADAIIEDFRSIRVQVAEDGYELKL